jgi:hypothetical protein
LQEGQKEHMTSLLTSFASASTIFGLAFFHFWSAIPAGIALGVTPLVVFTVVTLSYGSGAALVIIVGAPLRKRILRRLENHSSDEAKTSPNRMIILMQRTWERFGLVGLAVLAPMTIGSQTGAVIGLSFGARPLPLVIALTLGAAAWAALITFAVLAGAMTVSQL